MQHLRVNMLKTPYLPLLLLLLRPTMLLSQRNWDSDCALVYGMVAAFDGAVDGNRSARNVRRIRSIMGPHIVPYGSTFSLPQNFGLVGHVYSS